MKAALTILLVMMLTAFTLGCARQQAGGEKSLAAEELEAEGSSEFDAELAGIEDDLSFLDTFEDELNSSLEEFDIGFD